MDNLEEQRPYENKKPVLNNSLDFNMNIINPDWESAKPTINTSEFSVIVVNPDGTITHSANIKAGTFINVNDLITEIDYFPRDIRLSNYDAQDIRLARWFASMGGDLISSGYFRGFKYCFKELAVISETSQGRKGFLRKILNTIRSENEQRILEPTKKSLWTGKSDGGN